MNDAVEIALITGLTTGVPLLAAQVVNLIVSLRNNRKITEIKVATDGMKDELVKAALKEGHAQGVKDEKIAAHNGDTHPGALS
jgi:molybdenum cofactor biosynthesis enzyme MoaA